MSADFADDVWNIAPDELTSREWVLSNVGAEPAALTLERVSAGCAVSVKVQLLDAAFRDWDTDTAVLLDSQQSIVARVEARALPGGRASDYVVLKIVARNPGGRWSMVRLSQRFQSSSYTMARRSQRRLELWSATPAGMSVVDGIKSWRGDVRFFLGEDEQGNIWIISEAQPRSMWIVRDGAGSPRRFELVTAD